VCYSVKHFTSDDHPVYFSWEFLPCVLPSIPPVLLLSPIYASGVFLACHLPLPSNKHRLICDDCLEDKREDYQNCSVLYSVSQLYTIITPHIWAVFTGVLGNADLGLFEDILCAFECLLVYFVLGLVVSTSQVSVSLHCWPQFWNQFEWDIKLFTHSFHRNFLMKMKITVLANVL